MKIGSINNTNFKGLWQIKDEKQVDTIRVGGLKPVPVYLREAVYHPFQDESLKEAQDMVEKTAKRPVYMIEDYSYHGTNINYVAIKPSLGESLEITKKGYDSIKRMEAQPYPSHPECFCNSIDDNQEVQQIIDQLV